MNTIEVVKKVKWEIEDYYITEDGCIINPKTNKELTQSLVNYTIGYYLKGKFKSLKYIRENCKPYKDKFCPF